MRPTALSLVVAAHVLVASLVLLVENRFRNERPENAQLIRVMPITRTGAAPAPEEFRKSPERPLRPRRQPTPIPQTAAPRSTGFDPEPITEEPRELPRIDWQREIERSVRESGSTGEPVARYRSFDSKPKALDLPETDDEQPDGTVYQLPNGDKVARFRIGDRVVTCVSPQVALDEHFAVWAQFRPSRCGSRKPGSSFLEPPPDRAALKPENYSSPASR